MLTCSPIQPSAPVEVSVVALDSIGRAYQQYQNSHLQIPNVLNPKQTQSFLARVHSTTSINLRKEERAREKEKDNKDKEKDGPLAVIRNVDSERSVEQITEEIMSALHLQMEV